MIAELVSKDVFVASPRKGVAIMATSDYTKASGVDLLSTHTEQTRSDTIDVAYMRRSSDNGSTWSEAETVNTKFKAENGVGRRHLRGGFVEPVTGRFISIWTEGVLPTDSPLEGMRQWKLYYSVSEDGGRSRIVDEQVIHEGEEFDAVHHLPGVTEGKNCVMQGDRGERPLFKSDGSILVPVQTSPLGADGGANNLVNGCTYTDCMLLIGRWRDDKTISWSCSERICGDPELSTRGMIEPTIAELADGRILMVMRGGNHGPLDLPGYRWHSISSDAGMSWTKPMPWKYTDGDTFFSPSSCSQLISHSSGRLFWMGNICESNPNGNSPRHPIYLCEVDLGTGLLLRESVTVIDDLGENESSLLTLSNFYVREDRENGNLLLHMSRLFANDFRKDGIIDRTADALLYRIKLV